MNAFEYASPSTKESAVQLLEGGAAVLAGGTDLLSLIKDQVVSPKRLVSIKAIKSLGGISYSEDAGLRIGALVTLDELVKTPSVANDYPALVQAADGVRSAQLHNMGTVVGDLLQRPRCWYFRRGYGLLAMKDGNSMVPQGENRYHAILGNSGPAYFVNPSSFAPALISLGASLKVFGPAGEREVALGDFYQVPGSESEKEYKLQGNEIVTEIVVPSAAGAKNAVYEVRQKEALDWPLVAAAVVLRLDGELVKSANITLGQVAPVPWVAAEAASSLVGAKVDPGTAEAAGKLAVKGASPMSHNRFKVQLARVAVKRAILRAAGKEA